MRISNKQQRLGARAVHLGAAAALMVAIYGPLDLVLGLRVVLQVVVVPVLSFTGLWLWYGPRILNRLRPAPSRTLSARTLGK